MSVVDHAARGVATPSLSLIAAVSRNGVIGNAGQLPWRLPNDLRRFKKLTMGHWLLMGRVTYESIGRPLPGRTTVIITRQPDYVVPGCLVAHSIAEACQQVPESSIPFIIGGQQIYALALPFARWLYWTHVEAEIPGDTFFPPLDWQEWELRSQEDHQADADHAWNYSFRIYERITRGKTETPSLGPAVRRRDMP